MLLLLPLQHSNKSGGGLLQAGKEGHWGSAGALLLLVAPPPTRRLWRWWFWSCLDRLGRSPTSSSSPAPSFRYAAVARRRCWCGDHNDRPDMVGWEEEEVVLLMFYSLYQSWEEKGVLGWLLVL